MLAEEFDARFRAWVAAFCRINGRPELLPERVEKALRRIPDGLKASVVLGFKNNIVLERRGDTFGLRGLEDAEHHWIAASGATGWRVDWESLVRVAEYARVALIAPPGFRVGWDEDRMDVTLRGPSGRLVACYATEVDLATLEELTKRVEAWGKRGVNPDAPNIKGDDARRTAQALVRNPTRYFSTVAIGRRYEFGVRYGKPKGGKVRFRLEPDVIPFPQVGWPSVIGSRVESAEPSMFHHGVRPKDEGRRGQNAPPRRVLQGLPG